jgi:hypothetical protein
MNIKKMNYKIIFVILLLVATFGAVVLVKQSQDTRRSATVSTGVINLYTTANVVKNIKAKEEFTVPIVTSVTAGGVDAIEVKFCYDPTQIELINTTDLTKSFTSLSPSTTELVLAKLLSPSIAKEKCVLATFINKTAKLSGQVALINFKAKDNPIGTGAVTVDKNNSKIVVGMNAATISSVGNLSYTIVASTCTGTEQQCNANQPQKCSSGSWVNDGTACTGTTPICTVISGDAKCTAACTNGAQQCKDKQPQECLGGKWVDKGAACTGTTSGNICEVANGSSQCRDACTTSGEKRCSGNFAQICGGGYWGSTSDCKTLGCNATTKVCNPTCTPGKKKCVATNKEVACTAAGQWPADSTATACPNNGTCIVSTTNTNVTSVCIDKTCTENEWYCDGTGNKKQCNATGTAFGALQTCANCSKNSTTKTVTCGGTCTVGTSCNGDSLITCSAGGLSTSENCNINTTGSSEPTGGTCAVVSGVAKCVSCTAGDKTCYAQATAGAVSNLFTCKADRSGWDKTACANGCNTTTKVCNIANTIVPKISFKFAFAGIKPNATCLSSLGDLKIEVANVPTNNYQSDLTTEFSSVEGVGSTDIDGNQVFQVTDLSLDSTKFSSVNDFNYVKIKGPFHLKRRMCQDGQTTKVSENTVCSLDFTRTDNHVYDFSKYTLLAGDINGDGVINLIDFSMIKTAIDKSSKIECGQEGDLDLNGKVNSLDSLLIKNSLSSRDDE